MDPQPRFSVIIPAFNAENYIGDAINSVLSQTYKDFEIIVVDDNSRDKTGKVVHEIANPSVFLYNNTYGKGASDARNCGLSKCKGDYILFLDADDFYCNNRLFEILNNRLINSQNQIDILHFGYIESSERHQMTCRQSSGEDVEISLDSIINRTLYPTYSELKDFRLRAASPCTKTYRRDYIIANQIQFPSGVVNSEDAIFNLRVLSHNPRVKVIDVCGYYYWINPMNSGHKFMPEFYQSFDKMVSLFSKEAETFGQAESKKRINMRLFSYIVKVVTQYFLHPQLKLLNNNNLSGGVFLSRPDVQSIASTIESKDLPLIQKIALYGIRKKNFGIVRFSLSIIPNLLEKVKKLRCKPKITRYLTLRFFGHKRSLICI